MQGVFAFSEHNYPEIVPGEVDQSSGTYTWKDEIDAFCNKYGFYQEDNEILPEQLIENHVSEGKEKERARSSSSQTKAKYRGIKERATNGSSFTLLWPSPLSLVSREPMIGLREVEEGSGSKKLSTNQILRLAGKCFIDQKTSNESMNDANGLADDRTATGDKQDFKLVLHLLAIAEKISEKQFYEATNLIATHRRQSLASKTGTPVQRLAHYFIAALEKRIERETAGETSFNMEYKLKLEEQTICSKWKYNCAILSFYQQLPFLQSLHYASIQSILESLKTKTKVHIIDAHMRTGVVWAVLMHAIATKQEICPIKYIKITAIDSADDKNNLESIGRHLKNLSCKILDSVHFLFHIISLPEFVDKEKTTVEREDEEEGVVVYAPLVLIRMPKCLEKFMKEVRRIKPTLMVVNEVEANHSSPSFVNRFIEALFYYGAIFDSLEDTMGREDKGRMELEEGPFCCGMNNIVATEGRERVTRSVKYEVWRAYFVRFGMVEEELSESSLYQASLVVNSYQCGNYCTLEMEGNGKNCLVVGWKGTPLFSLSIWRFS